MLFNVTIKTFNKPTDTLQVNCEAICYALSADSAACVHAVQRKNDRGHNRKRSSQATGIHEEWEADHKHLLPWTFSKIGIKDIAKK